MNATHNEAAAAGSCPARLLLANGSIVDGTFRFEPSTFVVTDDRRAENGGCYLVYSERADGVLLLRRDHYTPIARTIDGETVELFYSAELGRFVTIPE